MVEGVLTGADAAWLMVRGDDGALETLARSAVDQIRMADPPRLTTEPVLEIVLEPGVSGRVPAELSYLTGGLSWTAEHTLVRTGEKTARWSSIVTVENASGRSFGRSVGELLGPLARREVAYSGVLPLLPPPLMLLGALAHRLYGVSTVKLKVGRSLREDLRNLKILRATLGSRADRPRAPTVAGRSGRGRYTVLQPADPCSAGPRSGRRHVPALGVGTRRCCPGAPRDRCRAL